MRVPNLALGLAAVFASAAPALAQGSGSSLTLKTPEGAPAHVIIDGAAWVCQGASCTAAPGGLDQPAERACRRVVRELGPVVAFTWQGQALSAEKVVACNAAVKR